MLDKNGTRIWDGDYVISPVCEGIVTGKNPATALIKVMNVVTGRETWVYPNHCTVVDEFEDDDDYYPNQHIEALYSSQ